MGEREDIEETIRIWVIGEKENRKLRSGGVEKKSNECTLSARKVTKSEQENRWVDESLVKIYFLSTGNHVAASRRMKNVWRRLRYILDVSDEVFYTYKVIS